MDNNYKSMCRVCLLKDPSSFMLTLADQKTRQMLFECTSVWVDPEDKYPQQMCCQCWKQCESWSLFQSLARASDRQLKFGGKKESHEEEDEEQSDRNIVKVKEEVPDEEGETSMAMDIIVKEEPFHNAQTEDQQLKMEKEDEVICPSEVVIEKEEVVDEDEGEIAMEVKEEPLDYIAGYSLATDEVDEEDEEEEEEEDELSLRDPLYCDNSKKKRKKGAGRPRNELCLCRYCPKTFPNIYRLNRHEIGHTNVRPFPCDKCQKMFKTKHSLNLHQSVHNATKPFECDQCDHKCTRKRDLAKHKLTHTGIRPFKCDECEKSFRSAKELAVHKLRHSGFKQFECDRCDMKFAVKTDLERHKLTHPETKRFDCDQCDKTFLQSCYLISHSLSHLTESPFDCNLCDAKFKHKPSLTRHLKVQHKISE